MFPPGIGRLDDPHLRSSFVLLAKARNRAGEVVGFASEMEEAAAQSNILQGRMHMLSTWTLQLPGRGTIFMVETEDASEFARRVVVPALLLRKTWDEPWTFTTTTGPRTDGRGTIVGGTGEFEGVSGSTCSSGGRAVAPAASTPCVPIRGSACGGATCTP